MNFASLKAYLDEKADLYERPEFIRQDPIQVPHRFSRKEDMEIIGLLTATIAWGQRPTIIKNALKMAALMEEAPYDFIMIASDREKAPLLSFVHRTFNGGDLLFFVEAVKSIYLTGGMEKIFTEAFKKSHSAASAISAFRSAMLSTPHESRTEKHISNPAKGSSAKRLNMFLRWMVRDASRGVDLGLWKEIQPAWLSVPLDVHTGNVARKLGMLSRKQNDQKAVQELDTKLREMDPLDPVKYDLALFGIGVNESRRYVP